MAPSSTPRIAVKSVKRKKGAPVQKRGPKGYFKGSRLKFLESQLLIYRRLGKGRRGEFWHGFWSTWWECYPWQLADDDEPPLDQPEEMARLASVEPGDETRKAAVEAALDSRLSNWFSNRATAANAKRDPLAWYPLLRRLHQLRNPRPRRRNLVQQFMHEYHQPVDKAFWKKYGDSTFSNNVEKLNLRYEVAKELFEKEYFGLADELMVGIEAHHNAELEKWNLILTEISVAEDPAQVRDSLFDATHPLLEAIGTYAGCHVSLIVGNAGSEQGDEFFTAVHWSPDDRASAKDWTQWDEDAFNSGVAGPFLTYVAANNKSLKDESASAIQGQQLFTLPEDTSTQSDDFPPPCVAAAHPNPTGLQSGNASSTAAVNSKSSAAVVNSKSSTAVVDGKWKGKYRPLPYLAETSSEGEFETDFEAEYETDVEGDGSTSGDSLASDAPAPTKRPRTSTRVTRSSIQTTIPGLDDTSSPVSIPTTPLSTSSSFVDLQGLSRSDSMDVDDLLGDRGHSNDAASGTPLTKMDSNNRNGGGVPPISSEATDASDTHEGGPIVEPVAPTIPERSHPIDMESVPSFLRSHGKGTRKVDIFTYLNQVKDPHFQRVLSNYVRFEVNDKSGVGGLLSTANRPIEITWWTGRARPATIPEYRKGGRTLSTFVDAVFGWWAFLQPAWRRFERDVASRQVGGSWESLYAPRINGLLNVVILVYWWSRILEEEAPEDGNRAEYEFFADDVAWVLHKLSI